MAKRKNNKRTNNIMPFGIFKLFQKIPMRKPEDTNDGNQKLPMVETRRYQWWKPEDTNGGNQKIPMRKPEDTNGENQKIPMVETGRYQWETRRYQW